MVDVARAFPIGTWVCPRQYLDTGLFGRVEDNRRIPMLITYLDPHGLFTSTDWPHDLEYYRPNREELARWMIHELSR
jgi:hypothetical protein